MAPKKTLGVYLFVNIAVVTLCVILYQKVDFSKAFIPFQHRQIHNIKNQNLSHLKVEHSTSLLNQTKRVLLFGFKRDILDSCPAKCTYHYDAADIDKYHAVILSPWLQKFWFEKKLSFPDYRDPNQYWVLYHTDHNYVIPYDEMKSYLGSFNLTMTWRPDSDVPVPYGSVEKLKSPKKVESMSSILATKNASIAWVVSHCTTRGQREIYARQLQKLIPVDIYGRCGNLPCKGGQKKGYCWDNIEKKYKFYLAFENSVCPGYVTEKTFRTLKMNMVPIVFGGANYKEILPHKSYIDVLDFGSPRELAKFLKKLDNEDELYSEYFQWKEFYKVHQKEYSRDNAFCQLCHKLHDPQHPHEEYKNVEEWMKNGCDNQLISRMKNQWEKNV